MPYRALLLLAVLVPAAARADTAFNTFSPTTQDYNSNIIFPLGGLYTQGPLAFPFTSAAGGQVNHFRFAAYTTTPIGSNPAPMIFSIYADAAGQPGALLGQWAGDAPATGAQFPQHPAPWDVDVLSGPTLEAGHSYFLAMGLSAAAPGWIGSSPADAGLPDVVAWRLSGASWTPVPPAGSYPAFTVTVPAPGTALMMLPLLIAARRRRQVTGSR